VETINELLALSNIPVTITVEQNDRLMASKNGSEPYRAAELSDGERNALLIGAEVLTTKPGTLLLLDEPERHLHRSIISPLLSHLFRLRPDCAFVIATHDLTLPVDNPEARVLLVRNCEFQGTTAHRWNADSIPSNADIDDDLKREIVGARRRVLFVEGDESSLDKPLYSVLFPQVSVRARRTSR
jgi:ABC-type cobalamin transport system ATPase subunit